MIHAATRFKWRGTHTDLHAYLSLACWPWMNP